MNRRSFLKSLGAVAALAVAGPTLAQIEPVANAEFLMAIRSGLVENKTFVMDGPTVVIDTPVTIRNCLFLLKRLPTDSSPVIFVKGVARFSIDRCSFQTMKG